ncbi:MAG: helix-turn-helix domain-containing protein [Nitrospinaceae bacterium]|nr:helix-turn-helix domain-containing protein [Nitrospinaceae bacterium]
MRYIVEYFLNIINQESKGQPGHQEKKISAAARNSLARHSWPGNVRELYNTLFRAAIWSKGATIDENDIKDSLFASPVQGHADILDQPIGGGFDIQNIISKVIGRYLDKALKQSGGNKSKAAKLLGLPNYQTFTNWMGKYGRND